MCHNAIHQLPLFVYGTLRPGEQYHNRLLGDHIDRVESALIQGGLVQHLAGNYPCLVRGEGSVAGELVWIQPEVWPKLIEAVDRFEEYSPLDMENSMYRREQVEAKLGCGKVILAWTYVWNQAEMPGPVIVSGDWQDR